ncbi:AsmA-like C-terminal domain-containing protein [Helicobacter sp. MIT 14-3879]|uniref:YhdP family protein n=1 Tax=Helicobacter sp. MIT 14-3879 TaxID=2040649 RepID=UPI0015F1B9DE|nr:AsmA-like C-terminal domain-containing protein [Helicobacter sp. MIT 14-3879]
MLIIILLFALIFKILSDGIKIDSISIANIKIDGLYLKLDKKLVLQINNIDLSHLKQSKKDDTSTLSMQYITKIIRSIITITSFFEHLEISSIIYQNETSSIYFNGNYFKVNIPYVLASFKLVNDGDDILLDIETLKIKQEELDIKGKILYIEDGARFAFDLESYINNKLDNVVSYQGETNFKYLNIVLDSTSLDSVDILAPYIKMLDSSVYEWMFKKASFDNITINRAYLYTQNLDYKNIDKVIVENLYAIGTLKNVSLKFEDELENINVDDVFVVFDKGKLSFYTQNASYDNVLVDKSIVEISDFFSPQTLLSLNLTSKNILLDNRILGILKFYGINIPILQKDGVGEGNINLDILLPTEKLATKVTPNGSFKVKNSNVSIAGMDLFIKESNINIKDNIIDIIDSYVNIDNILSSKVNVNINTKDKKIDLIILPSKLQIATASGDEIVNFNNKELKANMDFSTSDLLVNIDEFNISALINEDIQISINDINKLLPYAPILTMYDIKNGNVKLNINKDNKDILLVANLYNLKYPIYFLNKERLSSIQINGTINSNNIHLYNNADKIDIKIDFDSGYVDLSVKDKYINIDEILDSSIPIFANLKKSNNKKNLSDSVDILINASNIIIGLFGYDVVLDEAMLKTTQNGFIGNGRNKNGIANIILDGKTINVEANNFNADFVNNLFKKDVVYGGTFGVFGIYRDNKFVGDVSMLDTSVKNMASLQNILSFIDAIPSLVVFKLPGFSTNGYEINEANIRVGVDSDYIALEDININGSSVDITGNGVVDLKKEELNIRLELSTIKSLSSILNKIPIFGYILLGEDGKITTDLTIKGSINEPVTELSLLEDTAKAPINMLKRVFSPFQVLIEELKKENKKRRR